MRLRNLNTGSIDFPVCIMLNYFQSLNIRLAKPNANKNDNTRGKSFHDSFLLQQHHFFHVMIRTSLDRIDIHASTDCEPIVIGRIPQRGMITRRHALAD